MIAPSAQRQTCNAFCISGNYVVNDNDNGGSVTHLVYKKCKNAPATKGWLYPGLKQYLCACHKADPSNNVTPKHKWKEQTSRCAYCLLPLFGTELELPSNLFKGRVGPNKLALKWKATVTFCPVDRYEMVIVENKVRERTLTSPEAPTLLSVRGFEYYTHAGTYVSFDLRALNGVDQVTELTQRLSKTLKILKKHGIDAPE